MAYCSKCGGEVHPGVGYCPKCGQPQTVAAEVLPVPSAHGGETGMSENVAGLLCYVLGWLTGIIFLLIDKRPYVRFHAAQSIVVFGGLHILSIILGIFFGGGLFMFGRFAGYGLGFALLSLINLLAFILWILLMVKAYQGERFRVPVAADIADNLARK